MAEDKGFLGDLFDFGFEDFITVRIIKVIYILGMILIGIGALIALVGGLSRGGGTSIIFTVLVVPLGALLMIIFFRVYLELVVVIFRIGENSTEIARKLGAGSEG
jgi:ACR3 family arsenite efflux pump ArsB